MFSLESVLGLFKYNITSFWGDLTSGGARGGVMDAAQGPPPPYIAIL